MRLRKAYLENPPTSVVGSVNNRKRILNKLTIEQSKKIIAPLIEQARKEEREKLGEFLAARGMVGQDGSYPHFVRVERSEIETLKSGQSLKGE